MAGSRAIGGAAGWDVVFLVAIVTTSRRRDYSAAGFLADLRAARG